MLQLLLVRFQRAITADQCLVKVPEARSGLIQHMYLGGDFIFVGQGFMRFELLP